MAAALNCANYIQNRSPHSSVKDHTPFEAWSGTKSKVTHFRVFSSRAWARIPSEKRKALDPRSIECIFVGYPNGVKGYRLLIPSADKLIIERSVKFEESLSHAPQSPHADTFYLPHVRDDDSIHSDADTEHTDVEVEHADAETKSSDTNLVHANYDPHQSPNRASSSESSSPVINQRTRILREIYAQDHPAARNGLVGDNYDLQRTRSEFIEPPLVLTATEPSPSWHCHLVQSSNPQSYAEAVGHPSWESTMEEETHDSLLILVLYVDDLLITGSSASAIATVKMALHDRFLMMDMVPLHFFLGLEISQDATGIKLSQAKYARDLLERFRMTDCKPTPTPFLSGVRLEDGGETPLVDSALYQQLVGSLLYLTHSRPDLLYAVGAVSRYMQEPHELHWNVAKRILRYV
eukprot:PITA_34698